MPKAVLYMLLSSILFVIAHSCIKALSILPLHEVIFVRLLFTFFACLIYFYFKKINFIKEMTLSLFWRGFFGSLAMLLYFYTLTVMPLATAVTINFLSPMFSAIFAIFILKEHPHPRTWFFLVIAFIGVLLSKGFHAMGEELVIPWFDFMAAIGAAMLAALAYVYVRKAGLKSDPLLVVFTLPMIAILPALGSFGIYGFVMPTFIQVFLLILLSVIIFFAQFAMTLAYKYGEVSEVSVLTYLTIIWSIIVGYYVFGEKLTGLRLLGLGLILFAVISNEIFRFYDKKFKADRRVMSP